jgi:hypothetical protein
MDDYAAFPGYRRRAAVLAVGTRPAPARAWSMQLIVSCPGTATLRARRPNDRHEHRAGAQAVTEQGEKAIVSEGAMPTDWKPAERHQKDREARRTKKHGKS